MVNVIYFSNVTENTRRFVDRLGVPALRIPVREGLLVAPGPYVLITPTYGDGRRTRMVPHQVARFLRDPHNRALIRGVVASGNTNFGPDYARAGDVIAERCGVPLLHRFELFGTAFDAETVHERTSRLWQSLT